MSRTGWWSDDPPYHHPVFVITHHARPPVEMQDGTSFHFVTGGRDVRIGGGAAAA